MPEFKPFGPDWVRRETSEAEWMGCSVDDVPGEVVASEAALAARKSRIVEFGYDPEATRTPFAVRTRGPGTDPGDPT